MCCSRFIEKSSYCLLLFPLIPPQGQWRASDVHPLPEQALSYGSSWSLSVERIVATDVPRKSSTTIATLSSEFLHIAKVLADRGCVCMRNHSLSDWRGRLGTRACPWTGLNRVLQMCKAECCEMLRVASAGCDVGMQNHARLQDPARTSLLQQFPFSLSQQCGGLVRRCAHISWILKSLSNLSEGTVLTVSTLASPPGFRLCKGALRPPDMKPQYNFGGSLFWF